MEPETTPVPVTTPAKTGPANLTVQTPVDSHEVVLKPYITGYDKEAIEAVFYEAANVNASAGDPKNAKIDFDMPAIAKANRKSIERVVVSVDGSTDNVVDAVMNMRSADYEFVVGQINTITNPVDEEKKSD